MPFEALGQGIANLGLGIAQGMRQGTAEKERTFWASVADARKAADEKTALDREQAIHVRNRTEALSDLDTQQKFARQNEYLDNALKHIDASMELVQTDPKHFTDPQGTLERLRSQRNAMAADPSKAIDWTPLQDVTDAVAARNKELTDVAATERSHKWQEQQANIAKDLAAAGSKENNPHFIVNALSGDKVAMNEKDINRQIKAISATLAEHARGKGAMVSWGLPPEDRALQKEKQTYIDALRGQSYGKDTAEMLATEANQGRVAARGGFRAYEPNPAPTPIYQIPGVTPTTPTTAPVIRATPQMQMGGNGLPPDIPSGSTITTKMSPDGRQIYQTPDGRYLASDALNIHG